MPIGSSWWRHIRCGCRPGRRWYTCSIWWVWIKQWPNYLTLSPVGPALRITFVHYLIAFCSLPEETSDVISGRFVGPVFKWVNADRAQYVRSSQRWSAHHCGDDLVLFVERLRHTWRTTAFVTVFGKQITKDEQFTVFDRQPPILWVWGTSCWRFYSTINLCLHICLFATFGHLQFEIWAVSRIWFWTSAHCQTQLPS